MKQLSKPIFLTGICTAAGILAFFLQLWFFRSVDEKGLLDPSHPGGIVSCVITAGVLLFLAISVYKCKYTCQFSPSPLTAASALCAVAAIVSAVWVLLSGVASILGIVTAVFGAFALLCTAVIAMLRLKGHRAHPLLYCSCIVFFIFLLVSMYQQWSSEPELGRYCFRLLALVFLMLTFYQRTALKVGIGSCSAYLFFSRGALFFCLAAVPGGSMWLLYGAMAVSLILDGCTASPKNPQGV